MLTVEVEILLHQTLLDRQKAKLYCQYLNSGATRASTNTYRLIATPERPNYENLISACFSIAFCVPNGMILLL